MKETAVDSALLMHMVGGVGDHKRRHLGLVGVERNGIAGGAGGVASASVKLSAEVICRP